VDGNLAGRGHNRRHSRTYGPLRVSVDTLLFEKDKRRLDEDLRFLKHEARKWSARVEQGVRNGFPADKTLVGVMWWKDLPKINVVGL
jgi:hypothetical protein